MARGTKIEVQQQTQIASSKLKYTVTSLTNRTRPPIGHELTEDELQQLIKESENLTVVVKKSNKRR